MQVTYKDQKILRALGMHVPTCRFHEFTATTADLSSKLLQVALERFQDAKESMVMRFKDGKTDITIVVWDFGGQTVCSADDSKGN